MKFICSVTEMGSSWIFPVTIFEDSCWITLLKAFQSSMELVILRGRFSF